MPACDVWSGALWARTFNRQSVFRPTLVADDSDQTASLIAQIAAYPDGTALEPVTVFLPSGSYRIDGSVNIDGREFMIFDGEGVFFQYTDLNGLEAGFDVGGVSTRGGHWEFNSSNDCSLRRLTISGPLTAMDPGVPQFAGYIEDLFGEHGVAVQGASERIVVENIDIDHCHGDTIYVGGTGDPNLDITVRNIVGRYNGRQGIGAVLVDGLLVEDCDIQWGGRSGFDIEANHDTHFVWNAIIRRVTMGCKFSPFLGGGSGSLINPTVSDVLWEDCIGLNTVSSHTAVFAGAQSCHNLTIRRHVDIRQRSVHCLNIKNCTGTILVEDCNITSGPSTPTSYGIQFNNCAADVTIRNNTFNGVGPGGAGVGGADQLYEVVGAASPASITTCGNVWNMSGSNDGACP